jgi:putative mRNA 3-end processing factor
MRPGRVFSTVTVRLRDGVEIVLSDGTRIVCDADEPDGDVNVLSHAHGDHWPETAATVVCSPLTADLARTRRDEPLERTTDDRVELLSAGHVPGSRYLYTGDVCTRSRGPLAGFEPVDADVLVVEATYGEPDYELPPYGTVAAEVRDWLAENPDPVLLFGYALGRAQTLQRLASEADRTVYTTEAVRRVNATIERHRDVRFDVEPYEDVDLGPGDALVVPMTTARVDWIDRLAETAGATLAGFSGWAVEDAFRFRGNYDRTFPLSDHCDFPELLALVAAVDPDRVYTQHGSVDTLATELTRRGHDATALREDQTTLGGF